MLADALEHLVRGIVDRPEDVKVRLRTQRHRETLEVRVHPDDLQRVDDMLGATLSLHGWRLRGDPTLHPSGCKVSADEGDLDASVATRWQELCRLAAPGVV